MATVSRISDSAHGSRLVWQLSSAVVAALEAHGELLDHVAAPHRTALGIAAHDRARSVRSKQTFS